MYSARGGSRSQWQPGERAKGTPILPQIGDALFLVNQLNSSATASLPPSLYFSGPDLLSSPTIFSLTIPSVGVSINHPSASL